MKSIRFLRKRIENLGRVKTIMNTNYTKKIKHLISGAIGMVLIASIAPASAQIYKDVTRLGTSQAICTPGIESAGELQAFFANNPQAVQNILASAGWSGNAQDLMDAVAAGEFTEKLYAPGTEFEWMSARQGSGSPAEVALPYRRWAGSESFAGFEVNVVSNCEQHQIVIPNACCNVSLIGSTPVAVGQPSLTTSVSGDTLTVCSDEGAALKLVYPSGQTQTLALDGNGCWSGDLPSGSYSLEAEAPGQCGTGMARASATIAAAPMAPAPELGLIPYIGAFYGTETRMRYEEAWDMDMRDSSGVAGIRAGILSPISETLSLFVQGGYINRNGINEGNIYPEDNLFLDIGLEKSIGGSGFVGGGVGVWNIDDGDFDDGSIFVHGGSNIGKTPLQWFIEGRSFFDDIEDNKMLSAGVRYLFK